MPESATAQRIVAAAAAIIAEHGEGHLRINDVCTDAGVTSTTLYALFGDREHLVEAVLHHLFATTTYDAIRQFQALVMESTSTTGFRRMLGGVISALLMPERRKVRRVRLHALASIRHRPALRNDISALLRREIELFAAWVERANDAGLIAVGDPYAVAAWALTHTVAHTALDGDGVSSIDTHWDEVWRWALGVVLIGNDRPFPARPHSSAPTPTPPEWHPTALRIIDWAADRIDAVGESAFRAEHLPPEIAKSTTPIYRYFGTRENLVGAAQEERFNRSVLAMIQVNGDATAESLMAAAFSPDQATSRAQRLEAIASTLGRDEVAHVIAARRDANLAMIAASLAHGQHGADLFDGIRLGAAFLTGLAVVELLDLGIDADTHRAICLKVLHAALAASAPAN